MKLKIQITVIIAAVLGGVYFLSSSGKKTEQGSLARFSVDQFVAERQKTPERFDGKNVLLMGLVKSGTVVMKGETASFEIHIGDKSVPVYYDGAEGVPDTFKEGVQALLEGKLNAASGTFEAHKITTKCASKYKQEQI